MWIEVRFKLVGESTTADELIVPILVGQQEQELPIIGFNIIEEVLRKHGENPQAASTIVLAVIPFSSPQVGALVNIIQTRS